MKTKIFVLMLALCMILCACGGTASQDDGKQSTQEQSGQITTGGSNEETSPNGSQTTDPDSTQPDATQPDATQPELTLPGNPFPDDFQGIVLPPVIFDEEEDDGTLTSRPVNDPTDPPSLDDGTDNQVPSPDFGASDLLPTIPFFDPEA